MRCNIQNYVVIIILAIVKNGNRVIISNSDGYSNATSCYVYECDSNSYQFVDIFSNDLLIVTSAVHAATTIISVLNYNGCANNLLNSGYHMEHNTTSFSNNYNDTKIIDSLIRLVELIGSRGLL